jgi:hypothetical protein
MAEVKVREQMTAREDKERRDTSPGRLPDTTPDAFPGKSYDFTLQAVFEMKGTLGELTQAIKGLTEQARDNDKKLDHISHVVYAVGAVVTVLGAIAGVILREAWVLIEPILKAHFH